MNRILATAAAAVVASFITLTVVMAFPGLVPGTVVTRVREVPFTVTQTQRVNVTVTKIQTVLRDTAGPVWELVFTELDKGSREGRVEVYSTSLGKERNGIALALVVKAPDGYIFEKTVNGFVFRLEVTIPNKVTLLLSEASIPVVPGLDRNNYRQLMTEKAFSPENLLPYQNPRRAEVSPGPYSLTKERGMYQPYDWLAVWPISLYFHGLQNATQIKITFTYSIVEAR